MTAVKACAGRNVALFLMALVNYSPFISFNKPLPVHFSRKLSLVCPLDMPLTLGLRTCQPQKVQNACQLLTTKLAHFLKKTDRAVVRNTAARLFIQKNNLDLDLEPDEVLGPAELLFHYTSFSMCIWGGNINSACFVAVLRLNSTGITPAKQGLFHCINSCSFGVEEMARLLRACAALPEDLCYIHPSTHVR